ncbi:putative ataxia telangiectasia mutated (atm) [Schistosoma mansoni]|uniref:putative ataxia telangiectasia mutated (atm) n=1 Tax=Schistosoma mansoni TaxID=6183 RepID=UPI0001A6235F|nr:putative ataxia telangiectasia mutated (atm) [Schistosoma mansoni]|eukprot:XP_018654902.1 putative ataxia telangiectasia mutated (atm) [Schistosoma mansoni]
MRMEQRKHSSLVFELEKILSTDDKKIKVGKEIFRQLLIKNPNFMKMYKPLQSVTLPQALNLDYLTKMAICYVDNIMKIVRNFNEEEKLQETVKYLAGIHTNRGLTVAHFVILEHAGNPIMLVLGAEFKVSRSSVLIMDQCEIRRLVDDLVACTKRERKNNVFRLLNILQVPTNRQIISSCSDKKYQNNDLRVVSWNFIIENIVRVMITELQSYSGRGNIESRLNMEMTPYLKILQIVALHGSKGDYPINLNEFALFFLQIVKDKSVAFLHQGLFNTLCVFLLEARLSTLILDTKYRNGSCDSLVGQSKNIFVTNLGWVCHLLRWLLSNVYTNISDWQEVVVIIHQKIPSFINLVFNENQATCTLSINSGTSDKTKEMDPSQRYNIAIRTALQFHSEAWTKESTWDSLSLASSFTTILNSTQNSKSLDILAGNTVNFIEQTKVFHPAPAHLTCSSQFFLTEQFPKLCMDSHSSNIMRESTDLSTQQELFCLWRWVFVFCYYKRSFGQLTTCQENHTGSSVLHRYLLQEFNSITSRLSFQNEDTCWKTVSGLKNFFSLFAAVLVMEYDKNLSNHDNKSEIANKFFGEQIEHDTLENQRERKRARFEVSNSDTGTFVSSSLLWDNLVNLTNNNTKFGCLWWLIIDWVIRFMWQNTLIIRSQGDKYELYTDIEALLKIISASVKVNRIALANECLVTMLHTLVVLLNYELYQGSISHVPSDSVLSAYNEIWEFAVSLFEQCSIQRSRLQGHKREGSLSGYRFLNHDRLVCNLLSALFCLHNSTRNNHFKCANVSNICSRIFTSLMRCLDLDTSHLNNSPWRVRLIVLSSTCLKLPRNLVPCDVFLSVSTIPNVLLFNPGILFLLYNYTKIWNTDDDYAEKNTTIMHVPTEMSILLTGILWAYKNYLIKEFTPTIYSSNPWFHTGSNLSQPLFSNQDHIEAIDFIRKNISVHTRLNPNLSVTSENIPSLVVFLATELSFIQYKFCLLKKKCKYLDELPSCYAVMLERVLKQILDNLISSKYQWCDSVKNDITNFSVQLSTDDFNQKFKKLEMFAKSLEVLLELLAFSIDDISWISSPQLNQLILLSTSYLSFSTSEQLISENTFQPLAVSSQVKKTNFGDEDFEDADSSVTVEITNNQDHSEEIYSRNNLYQSIKFQIFNSLFLFSLRSKNINLLKQIYQSLHESMSKIVLNDHDSIKWLSKLTRNISQSMYKTFSGKNYDYNLNTDFAEMITYFISSIVDTVREILKFLLARCSQYLCINLIVKLIRSLCVLSNSMVYIYVLQNQANLNLEEMGQWKLIGQHIDQLIRTVWSVGFKVSGKSLQGFEVATVDCLNFWMNLYSAKIIDKQNNPEYCLVPTVQHIVPIAASQLAKFLQRELCPVLGNLALTDFYEPTMKLHDINMISSLFTDHVPELVGAILIHSVMQNMDDNSRLPQWHIITELCGGSKLTHSTLLKATNICKLIHCLLKLRVLYDMPNKSTGSSQSLTNHHYLGSFLINCLAKLYINLNYDQLASNNQISDTRHHLKYAYDLISSCHINSDLVNRLYQIGIQFLCPQSTINVSHRLIPYCLRLTCWCAISNLIISLLLNTTSSFDSDTGDNDELRLVQEFSVWIFVNGHISLLVNELTRNLAKNLLQSNKQFQSTYPDELKRSILKKIATILNLLVGENKPSIFNEAVRQLCDFPDIEKCNYIDSSSTDTSYISFFEEYGKSRNCLSTRNGENIQQLLQIMSNDLELFHIVHSSQLLVYPIKMFEELSFNMSTMFNVMQGNRSTFKSDMLFQQIKSILMKQSTENKERHVGLMVTNMNNIENGGNMTEIDFSNIAKLTINLETILNPSKPDKWFQRLPTILDSKIQGSTLHCFSLLKQVTNSFNLSNFNLIDPASRGFNYEVPESDDFLDPVSYVKQQILSNIVCAICIPNSLITLNASEVLHELFNKCSSLVISLLTHPSENQLPTYLHTILAPYIQGTDISSRSTSTRNKNPVSFIQKLDLKEKAQILENLPVLTNKLRLFLENSLTICCNTTNFQSWLIDFLIWFLESGLIQDDFLTCIKPLLHFSYESTEKLCSWLIAYFLIRIGSNNTVDKSMQQFTSALCDGITTCLSHSVNSSHTELPRFQKILLETLIAFNHFIQWIKRSGENITLNPSITINWLCAADRATTLKRPQEARLFLELAWLSDNCPDDWITTNEVTYRIWVNLCRLSGDLMGLIASQTSFLTWNNSGQSSKEKSAHFDVHPLLDKTKLAVHELLGNWSYLLSCYDKYDLNEELDSSSNNVHSKLASCLQRLGANRLFEKFSLNESIDLTASKQSDLTLKELRSAAAWRLNQWDNKLNDISNLDYSYSHSICPPTDWKDCGLETSFYWLLRAASQSDWCRVSEIATAQREQGDYDLSISRLQSGLQIVNEVIEQTDKSSEHLDGYINCYIHGITVLCNWLYESRTKSAADLLLNYINPAINLAQRLKLNPDANAFMCLAKFSDAQFTTLNSYLTSSEFATRQNFLTQAQKDVIVLSDLGEKSRLLRLLQRQSALEIDELTALTTDADHFLEASIDAYAQCLSLSDDHNLSIFRFISLWLSSINSKFPNRASKMNKIMSERLPSIRADKFLPLVPQLAVRLSSKCDADSSFQNILMKLIERMVDWHPHHSAFTLLFLVNAKLDDDNNDNDGSRQRSTRVNSLKASTETIPNQSSTELSCRIQAAQQLYNRLSIGRRKELLYQMKYLAEAYVDWANTDVDKYKTNAGNISLPNSCKLYGLVSPSLKRSSSRTMDCLLELVALPTCTFPIDRSGTYPNSSLIRVGGFSPDFRLVGGINLPKVIGCLGTDGKLYRQLVKGKDDPRQDAVMQQVFIAANCLLTKYGKSNKIDLPHSSTSQVNILKYRANWLDMDNGIRIRTYKVIPMAQRSGVIEWCEDTVPLGDWLANERTGAHQRYRPRDMPPIQAKQRLGVVKDKTPDRKLVAFNEICEKLKPVLAYFFLEQFPNPKNWFVSRMAYIRSIAVTSVVGYLVGLGDRHPHNLLLHKSTGEIIHIDLGVAFDQVLLFDPLYSWSLSPAQLYALEAKRAEINTLDKSKSSKPVNQLAERVLLGVKGKLQGLVSGNLVVNSNETSSNCSGGLDQLDVAGHIGLLVRAATDYSNLSRMYFGWQAYL